MIAIALWVYPRGVRAERGPEMTDTLLQATTGRGNVMFAREVSVLAARGLQARANVPADSGVLRDLVGGARLACPVLAGIVLATYLNVRALRFGGVLEDRVIGLIVILALVLVRRDRLAGTAMVAWLAWLLIDYGPRHSAPLREWAGLALPLIFSATMALAPLRQPRSRFEIVAFVIPLVALTHSQPLLYLALALAGAAAVATIRADARPTIAAGLICLTVGLALALFPNRDGALTATLWLAALALLATPYLYRRSIVSGAHD